MVFLEQISVHSLLYPARVNNLFSKIPTSSEMRTRCIKHPVNLLCLFQQSTVRLTMQTSDWQVSGSSCELIYRQTHTYKHTQTYIIITLEQIELNALHITQSNTAWQAHYLTSGYLCSSIDRVLFSNHKTSLITICAMYMSSSWKYMA